MYHKVLLFVFFILYSTFTNAQSEDSLEVIQGDTLETIVTDSSIIYVIKQAPLTITEKYEVVRPKEKIKYYLDMNFSLINFWENRKSNLGYESYVSSIDAITKDNRGYSMGASIWKCQKKIYTNFGIEFMRLHQLFNYTDLLKKNYSSENHFNYTNGEFKIGYWFKKNKNISFIISGGLQANYLVSYSGFTLKKSNNLEIDRLNNQINYNKYSTSFLLNMRILLNTKKTYLNIEPFIIVSPFSKTSKNEVYKSKNNIIGIKLILTNKLF